MDSSVERYGPRAWLVRFGRDMSEETMQRALSVARALEARPPAGLVEFTMGYASVLLEFETDEAAAARVSRRDISRLIEEWSCLAPEAAASRTVEIPVVYDGEDLAAEEVVARHVVARLRARVSLPRCA